MSVRPPPIEPAGGGRRAARDRPGRLRHSYATAGQYAKIDWKALRQRIGYADVAFTIKQYVQTNLEADRQVANTLAELIIGGALALTAVNQVDDTTRTKQTASRDAAA